MYSAETDAAAWISRGESHRLQKQDETRVHVYSVYHWNYVTQTPADVTRVFIE